MSSEAQIRANQENARKSTGPKSDSGKARVAQNARKHGFSSREVMLTSPEDIEAYDELVADYTAQYPFRHAQKPHLIATMANAEMQIRLINRAKVGAMQYYNDVILTQLWGLSKLPTDPAEFYEVISAFLGIAFLRDAYGENVMLKLNRYETEQQRIWHRAARHIEQLYFRWRNEIVEAPAEESVETQSQPADEPVTGTKPIPPEIQTPVQSETAVKPETKPEITAVAKPVEAESEPPQPKAA